MHNVNHVLNAALDYDYPGFGGAVTERMLLNAHSMHNFLNTPDGAVYGFAPTPPQRGIWAGIRARPARRSPDSISHLRSADPAASPAQ